MAVFMVERRFLIPVKYDIVKALGTLADQHFQFSTCDQYRSGYL